MIPTMNIIAWGNNVPWVAQRQVEQDLIISRALVDMFNDSILSQQLRMRGGTALNKLHFSQPYRYSEDIDLVKTEAGPIGPVLDALRSCLEPWLGKARISQGSKSTKLLFRVNAEDPETVAPLRLKVEINTREIKAYDPPATIPYEVENPWFSGEAQIPTFTREEMLATKLRALLQRNKGRDLFDLDHGLRTFEGVNTARIVEIFACYLEKTGLTISRAVAQKRMFEKLANPTFLADMRPLVSSDRAASLNEETAKDAFQKVLSELIDLIPGDDWKQAADMLKRFALKGRVLPPTGTILKGSI